jgi:hypothetical protein
VEALLTVKPGERLELVVGQGGSAGVYGIEVDHPDVSDEV